MENRQEEAKPAISRRNLLKTAGLLAGASVVSADTLCTCGAGAEPRRTLTNLISVRSPAYRSTIHGTTTISVEATGVKKVTVNCWGAGGTFGRDSTVGCIALNGDGRGSVAFHADEYPHGPITVRIVGFDGGNDVVDRCYLQLYNAGGVRWMQGMPKAPPPQAQGMSLVFADDFNQMPSISSSGRSTYYDHKPPNGSEDFSSIPFTGYHQPNNPFSQMDTWLRIRADANKNSTGIIASIKDYPSLGGIVAKAPCYFECRFIAPNAVGTWPAFWLLTCDNRASNGCDELDIIEAYGGNGAHEPNAYGTYMVTPHAWNQGAPGDRLQSQAFKAVHDPIRMKKFGIPSTWYQTPHIYGCKITRLYTFYYCDNIEVAHHLTLPLSKYLPFFFLVNLATGGGWPVDLSRYNGIADMYVDYVRVYAKNLT